jgi:hypothetical protein
VPRVGVEGAVRGEDRCVWVWVWMYVYMYMGVDIYIYIYIYIYISREPCGGVDGAVRGEDRGGGAEGQASRSEVHQVCDVRARACVCIYIIALVSYLRPTASDVRVRVRV